MASVLGVANELLRDFGFLRGGAEGGFIIDAFQFCNLSEWALRVFRVGLVVSDDTFSKRSYPALYCFPGKEEKEKRGSNVSEGMAIDIEENKAIYKETHFTS